MKKLNKLFCLLLALVLIVSMIPIFAAAETTADETEAEAPKTAAVTVKVVVGNKTLYTYQVTVGDKPVSLHDKQYISFKDSYYKYSVYKVLGQKTHTVTIPAYDGTSSWETKWANTISVVYTAHSHKYKPSYNRIYHWSICACGKTTNEIRHVDPAADDDKICTCGYRFNDNAELTTLWLANMQLSPRFTKDVTEYIGEVHTYMDVKSTSISATSFDALAKVQLPENLEIHEGANKFEIHVTAEDKTAIKVYTVIAVKPVKVEDALVGTDTTTVSAALKTKVSQKVASAAVSDAVCEKMLDFAAADNCRFIALRPDFSKWSVNQVELSLTGQLLKTIFEKTSADLILETPYESTLTIPHSQLGALAKDRETLILCIRKDNTFDILSDGEAITPSALITFTIPEA